MQATMERSPQSRFPLSDILPVPIQRVMRYPLLIKELEKCAKKASQQTQMAQMERLMNLLEVSYVLERTLLKLHKMHTNFL